MRHYEAVWLGRHWVLVFGCVGWAQHPPREGHQAPADSIGPHEISGSRDAVLL